MWPALQLTLCWASAALTGNRVGMAEDLGHHSFPPPRGPACFTAGSVHTIFQPQDQYGW